MYAGQAEFNMGMFAGQGLSGWQDTSGALPWWTSGKASPHSQGLDCVDLLSAARELAGSLPTSPHGLPLQSVGFHDYGEFGMHDGLDGMGSLLSPHLCDEPQS